MHANGPEELWRKNNGFKTQGVTVSSWLIISFKFFIYLLSVDNQLFTMIDLFITPTSFCHRIFQLKAQHYNRYKWRKQNEFRSCNLSGSIGIFSQSLPFHLIVSP